MRVDMVPLSSFAFSENDALGSGDFSRSLAPGRLKSSLPRFSLAVMPPATWELRWLYGVGVGVGKMPGCHAGATSRTTLPLARS
jgi:hypothetical protein